MSLDRVITAGVGVVVLAVTVPWLAPGLIQGWPAADNAQVGDAQGGSSPSNGAGKPHLVPGYSHQVALSADGGGHYLADATIDGDRRQGDGRHRRNDRGADQRDCPPPRHQCPRKVRDTS